MVRVLLVSNSAWNIFNFRMKLVQGLREEAGLDVEVVATPDGFERELECAGLTYHAWFHNRRSINPLSAVASVNRLRRLYRKLRPQIVHHFTVKPVLFGTTAARLAGVPGIINCVTGLPYYFMGKRSTGLTGLARRGALQWYARSLYGARTRCTFQNNDDLEEISAIVPEVRASSTLINGSGVDLSRFHPRIPASDARLTVTFIGRLIREKGIHEFMEGIETICRTMSCPPRVVICGTVDQGNRSAVSSEQLSQWKTQDGIEFRGHVTDMVGVLNETDVAVLPSYREGVPRSLLEAASSGIPIVTTDVPGCREVVEDGVNGILVPPHDGSAVGNAILKLLGDAQLRQAMGTAGRRRMEERFDERLVVRDTIKVYKTLLQELN